jgi:hypothetical protein
MHKTLNSVPIPPKNKERKRKKEEFLEMKY